MQARYTGKVGGEFAFVTAQDVIVVGNPVIASPVKSAYVVRGDPFASVVKEGFMSVLQRRDGGAKSWRRAFAMLTREFLRIYKSPSHTSPILSLNVSGVSVGADSEGDSRGVVTLKAKGSAGKVLRIRFEDEAEKVAWMDALLDSPSAVLEEYIGVGSKIESLEGGKSPPLRKVR